MYRYPQVFITADQSTRALDQLQISAIGMGIVRHVTLSSFSLGRPFRYSFGHLGTMPPSIVAGPSLHLSVAIDEC
jgi:hypothetical protein